MAPPSPAFSLSGWPPRLPVLLSVPHAGCAYSAALLREARLSRSALAILEDPLVDRLVLPAVAAGAAAIIAHAPRAQIDLNRSANDLDPTMVNPPPRGVAVSRRARAGLGLIPSRLSGHGAVWRRELPASEVQRRIADIHRPYHEVIAERLDALRARFGAAVLIDCHSMPPRGGGAAAVVLGDRHGTSSAARLVEAVEEACRAHRLQSSRNDPYAGGEIVARHGRPAEDIHAIQIEVDRGLYLAPDLHSAGPGFERAAALIVQIVKSVARAAMPDTVLLAAE